MNITSAIAKITSGSNLTESEMSEVYRNAFVHHRKDLK